jgi:hypothetical protein
MADFNTFVKKLYDEGYFELNKMAPVLIGALVNLRKILNGLKVLILKILILLVSVMSVSMVMLVETGRKEQHLVLSYMIMT